MREQKQLINILDRTIQNALNNIHTATIAKVIKVNEKTIDVKVVINQESDGESLEFPVFIEVPPVFSQGGSSYTAHPIAADDYCLLIITERCFDNWYSGRDNVVPPEFRVHDYSDAFAIVGVNPLAAAITIPQVITHIGDTYQEGNYEHVGNMDRTGDTDTSGNTESGTYSVGGAAGFSGSIPGHNGKTATFVNGICTNIG